MRHNLAPNCLTLPVALQDLVMRRQLHPGAVPLLAHCPAWPSCAFA